MPPPSWPCLTHRTTGSPAPGSSSFCFYGQRPAAATSSLPTLGLPELLGTWAFGNGLVGVLRDTEIGEECVQREAHRKLQKGSRKQRGRAQDLEPDCLRSNPAFPLTASLGLSGLL